jgi:peptidoglycan hydrolase-like protein with peptidoglycan-binding domain
MAKPTLRFGSRGPDVIELQTRLNASPPTRQALLVPDGQFGGKTRARVREFQGGNQLAQDGIVGPKTWGRLQAARPGIPGPPVPKTPPVPGTKPPGGATRSQIVKLAMAEVGRVSDRPTKVSNSKTITTRAGESFRERFGWTRLQRYMGGAMRNPPPGASSFPAKFSSKQTGRTHTLTQLEGVQCVNMRVPLHGQLPGGAWNGVQWCGIFATWVLVQAGLKVEWVNIKGITEKASGQVKRDFGGKGIQPGDVCVIARASHHFIITEVNGNSLKTIAGNSHFQEVASEVHTVNEIVATYRILVP